MKLTTHRIGDLCDMVRGEYPTMKTEPGEYPLVVTAAYRRTASTYQLEGPAVCIPLVSSTGHGDAALHRVHYQDGRFALANLLVALLPKNQSTCDAKYLYYLLNTKKDAYFVPLMLGTANVSLKERDIADVEVPLPLLTDQRRIVAKVEELAAKIDEARTLQQKIGDECDALCRSILMADPKTALTPMDELVSLRNEDVSVLPTETYHFAGIYCFGRGVFVGDRKTGLDFAYKSLTRLRTGDFVYPKLMAWEGALGIVPAECGGLCVSPEYPVFTVNTKRVLPETLDVYYRTPSVWPKLAEISTGTNVRRRRLNPKSFLAYQMPLPSMETQLKLRAVKSHLGSLKSSQSQSAAELDALLPSILDKAFKGEL